MAIIERSTRSEKDFQTYGNIIYDRSVLWHHHFLPEILHLDVCDEKEFYIIEIILVTTDGTKHFYEQLKMPIPGEPDAPKLWLVKTSDSNFAVEWSEPKSYGIPVIGFQLYIEGKKAGNIAEVHLRRAEIPSNVNRTYDVNICALTNNPQRTRSIMSQTLSIVTAPTVRFAENEDGMIHVRLETLNEEKVSLDWSGFSPRKEIRAYYVHYTCLNNKKVKTMKILKHNQQTVRERSYLKQLFKLRFLKILKNLKPGFTYTIMVLAADKDGEIVYTSDKHTVQMSVPPNAPIVAIR